MGKAASHEKTESVANILMAEAVEVFKRLVMPSVVPIYDSLSENRADMPRQVGSGFLVAHHSRPVLITAKHTLRGRTFSEGPGDKAVHVDGRWVYIGDGIRTIVEPTDRDVVMTYMDEFDLGRCLTESTVSAKDFPSKIITLGGFLARDFKRDGATLRPAPFIYTNVAISIGAGLVGLRYPKRRNVDTKTSNAVVTSVPSGLSGCPLVDTLELLKGSVRVVGVFTEQDNGQARGEDATVIQQVMASL